MTEIENELRAWMQERAACVHASPEILTTDYRPRVRSWRPKLAVGGFAVVAGTVAAVLSLGGGASTAFAGWSPQPTTASPAQVRAAERACGGSSSGLSQQLVDTRGPYTILVYAGPAGSTQAYDFCTDGPYFESSSAWTTDPPVTAPAGQLYLWSDHTAGDDQHPYGAMIAQAGAGITGANLTLTDGTVVTATVQNGWVIGWWPGDAHVASAQLTTANGTVTQTFNYPCDIHNCNGGPHGGAPGGPGGG